MSVNVVLRRPLWCPLALQWICLGWRTGASAASTARDTPDSAAAIGFVACFTPVRSPESNGVSAAFVKALKPDYSPIDPRPDALTVMEQLPGWIEDYNENHPHSGLRMRSTREFIRSKSAPAPYPV